MKILIFFSWLIIFSGCTERKNGDHDTAQNQFQETKHFTEPGIDFSPQSYICYRTNSPVIIDGKPDESVWDEVPWTDDFVDIQGPSKPKPRFRTRAKMLWDDHYFYVAAEMEEPDVWATLKKRDSIIFHDNDFEIFIDPDGDTHRYYELEINAYGTAWDLFLDRPYRDGGKAIFFWDIRGLKSGVYIDGTINRPGDRDRGWSVEMAFPWDVLKECSVDGKPPKPCDHWRVNFSRVEWKTEVKNERYVKVIDPETGKAIPEDNWVWSAQGLINMHYPEMWGYVQFSSLLAGQGKDNFRMNSGEEAKWSLRQIYYRERDSFLNKGRFTDDLSKLGLGRAQMEGYAWPPKINHTWTLFEARLVSLDGKEIWSIRQDGRVWKQSE